MRSFIISVVIITLIAALTFFNFLYIDSLTNEMLDLIDSLPPYEYISAFGFPDKCDELERLLEMWKSNIDIVAVSMNLETLSAVTLALNNTNEFFISKSLSDYCAARTQLYESIMLIRTSESFSIFNVI